MIRPRNGQPADVGLHVNEEREGRSPPLACRDRNVAAHGVHDIPANGEAQTGAAIPATAVQLDERPEEPPDVVRGDSNARVDHGDMQEQALLGMDLLANIDRNAAVRGEFDGVIDEVGNELAQPDLVADQRILDIRRDLRRQREAFFLRRPAEKIADVIDDVRQQKRRAFNLKMSGLDLREIQDIVKHRQETARRP